MKAHVIIAVAALVCASRLLAAEQLPLSTLEGWQPESGNWRIEDGTLLHPDVSAGRSALWLPDHTYADVDISVEYFIHPEGDGVRAPGVIYRAVDQYTYYYVHFDQKNSQVVWVRSASGNEWTEARRHRPIAMKTGEWQTVRIKCQGDTHEVYLDGSLLFSEKDATLKHGAVGLRAGQGKIAFRNLSLDGTRVLMDPPFKLVPPKYLTVCSDAGTGAYEAFPDVCRTKTGDLICVFYAGYGHVSVPTEALPNGARISMCRSKDDGRTWSEAQVVVDSPIDDRDASITQLSNGDLLVVYMSYDPKRQPGTHQVFTVRSTDDGNTWSEPTRVPTPFKANEAVSEPAREMPDSSLLLPVYGTDEPGRHYITAVLKSTDMGTTWETLSVVRSDQYDLPEPSLVRLPDGKLLMLIRPTMVSCESTDEGKTWTELTPVGIPGDAPYLLLTRESILLCSFRHRPTTSTDIIYSTDFGKTWSERVMLDKVLGAYPSMVQLPDGRVLVVYYVEGGGSDIRCMFVRASADGIEVLDPTADQ